MNRELRRRLEALERAPDLAAHVAGDGDKGELLARLEALSARMTDENRAAAYAAMNGRFASPDELKAYILDGVRDPGRSEEDPRSWLPERMSFAMCLAAVVFRPEVEAAP